jgi:hypothetical protein
VGGHLEQPLVHFELLVTPQFFNNQWYTILFDLKRPKRTWSKKILQKNNQDYF